MASGKSSELIRLGSLYNSVNLRVLYINSKKDTRSSKDFSTHNSTLTEIAFDSVKTDTLEELKLTIENYDVLCIDEAQFFTDLVPFCLFAVEKSGKIVIVSSIDGDSNRKKFGDVFDLIPYADSVTKLSSICIGCRKNGKLESAHFTKRIVKSDQQILIGNLEAYEPCCRNCYF